MPLPDDYNPFSPTPSLASTVEWKLMPWQSTSTNTISRASTQSPYPLPRSRLPVAVQDTSDHGSHASHDRNAFPTQDSSQEALELTWNEPVTRPFFDPGRSQDKPWTSYNEYFLPEDGIDWEVIELKICRYLGQDATVNLGNHIDGRRGFIVRAYRPFTTARMFKVHDITITDQPLVMVQSLKEISAKHARKKEDLERRNQTPNSVRATFEDTHNEIRSRTMPRPYRRLGDSQIWYGDDAMVMVDPQAHSHWLQDNPLSTPPTA